MSGLLRVLGGLLAIPLAMGACVPAEAGRGPAKEAKTLRPGATLPSSEQCAKRTKAGKETRPMNVVANTSTPPRDYRVPAWTPHGYAPEFNAVIVARIDGQFTGTTDQIIAWGACRWGFDADVARAVAMEESTWRQSTAGDLTEDPAQCVGGARPPCPTSFGLMQLKHTFRPGSWPYSQQHTAFNVDYALGVIRGCYEGWVVYLENGYRAGDLWGCLGWHFSGEWKDPGATDYIARVRERLRQRGWEEWR